MTAHRTKTRVVVLAAALAWTVTGSSARADACQMRATQPDSTAAMVQCAQHAGAVKHTRADRSEHDCCKTKTHSCCFKMPSRSGTPSASVSVDAPRLAAVLPAILPALSAQRLAGETSHRAPVPGIALAPPVLRL